MLDTQLGLWTMRHLVPFGFFVQRYPVALPGTSLHEAGFSIDINWPGLDRHGRAAVRAAAAMTGFRQVANDAIHFQWSGGYGSHGTIETAIRVNQARAQQGVPSCGS